MAWFKVDDKLWGHPKWLAVPMRARGLWVTAGSWCAANETDGRVPRHVIRSLGGTNADAAALVDAALWREVKAGWIFHEWSIYQPDAASLKAKRRAESDGGALGNHKRWHTGKNVRVDSCDYCQGLPPEADEPPIDEPADHRVPDQGGEGVPESPPNRPVPEPDPDSSQTVSGGGSVSSGATSQAPPIQRCGEAHPSAQPCSRCGDLRAEDKAAKAQAAKDAKAAARASELARSHAAIHGDDDTSNQAGTMTGAEAIQALKAARKEKA